MFNASIEAQVRSGMKSALTAASYRKHCRWLCKHLGKRQAGSLKGLDFTTLRQQVAAGAKVSSINERTAKIMAVFNWAYENELIESLPRWASGGR